jgi:hypothetical protein
VTTIRRSRTNGRYSALLLFQYRVVSARTGAVNRRRLCEKRLILLQAAGPREALRRAKRRGQQSQHNYDNAQGDRVYFEFIGVMDLLALGLECEADEVWYDLTYLLKPMEQRHRWCPPEAELGDSRRRGVIEEPLDRQSFTSVARRYRPRGM